jgi:hypothetical protein
MKKLLCVIGMSLWSATAVARQAAPAAALPPELRAHVQNGRLDMISSLRGLPLGVRTELALRRLVAAGCSYEDCLVYYERGSGAARTWRVMLLHWTPNATTFEWGGTAPGGLATIDAVRSAVLSGAIKGSAGPW